MNTRWLSSLVVAGLFLAQLGAVAQSTDKPSLYKRLGGYDAIAAVTDDFIGRLAADPDLGQFFKAHSTASLQRIRQFVVDQLCAATGGPCVYVGQPMKTVDAGLGITDAQWKKAIWWHHSTVSRCRRPSKTTCSRSLPR
jgi:hemoglobin